MKRLLPILLTLIFFVVTGLEATAGPEDWVGKQLPELKVEFLSGKAEPGKPMVIEFWATWCPPCLKSIPHLNEIYRKYKDKGLVMVGISDEDKATIEKFQKSMPMDYAVASSPGAPLAKELGVRLIPTAFLVDKSGKIVWVGRPLDLTDAEIEKLLK